MSTNISCLETFALNILKSISPEKIAGEVPKEDSPTLKKLINELFTDVSEISKVTVGYNENATDLLQFNDNITYAESRNESINQEVIQCYYSFGNCLLQRLNYYKSSKHGNQASQAVVNEEVREQIGGKISNDTLHKRTEKA
ncbi:911_t:CDS:2 [Ambispora gerdemannii]|uniref:911_t:CDS:1 n=1 Tax=Ambispora gerdemannii TaxID=144530 RepID=A0A9N9CWW5_9GLOM|nr:911_t:CDS:2 [Ambispora gerdemannii]